MINNMTHDFRSPKSSESFRQKNGGRLCREHAPNSEGRPQNHWETLRVSAHSQSIDWMLALRQFLTP